MAIKFQYNKVSLQEMQKQLKRRLDTLPVLKFKEAILRAETEKVKNDMEALKNKVFEKIQAHGYLNILWHEFPLNIITVSEIKTSIKNIAGVKLPHFEGVNIELQVRCLFNYPFWIFDGAVLLKELIQLSIEKNIFLQNVDLLEAARKKTTQKVNLYQKIQVPGYLDAISKIKNYLNDEESLSKATQKIMKKILLSL